MARTGRPPVPVERKRATGNPGKRPLPERGQVVQLDAAVDIPTPPRPLGPAGLALWDRAWKAARHWLSPATDIEILLMVAEQVDERVALRMRVIRDGNPEDRKALRDVDRQVVAGLSLLGFTPTDRSRLGLAEVKAQSKLEELRAKRA
jgi:hypothetical protein